MYFQMESVRKEKEVLFVVVIVDSNLAKHDIPFLFLPDDYHFWQS